MMNNKTPNMEKELLRVALDKYAAHAYAQMAERLKAANEYVRVQPSAFVSFLVTDFYNTYFEKDLGLLVAEFFDAQSYHEAEFQRAKASGDFERVMSEALATIKKMKSKARRKATRGKKQSDTPEQAE